MKEYVVRLYEMKLVEVQAYRIVAPNKAKAQQKARQYAKENRIEIDGIEVDPNPTEL